jgi:hypothetical protein
MQNVAMNSATLTTVGNQYRLEIPFEGNATASVGATNLQLKFSGQFVAYADAGSGLTPEIANGGFEWNKSWTSQNSVDGRSHAEAIVGGAAAPDQTIHNKQVASITAVDGTASMYQEAIHAGLLQPDTQYLVSVDVGNPALANGPTLDQSLSAKAFFTLGSSTDFANHVGGYYQLASLAEISNGQWRYQQTFILDTVLLTPEQLAMPLNVVLQATSTHKTGFAVVLFDNVRLTVVPEPAGVILGLLAGIAVGICACRRKYCAR